MLQSHLTSRDVRPRQNYADKKHNTLRRVQVVLGLDRISSIQRKWNSLDTKNHSKGDGDIGDGILLCLQRIGLSQVKIQAILRVGSSRLTRIRKFTGAHTHLSRHARSHALNIESVDLFKRFFKSLEVEDGFPCAHRRLKCYVLREGKMVTWKELYE